jgi:chitodextrinase
MFGRGRDRLGIRRGKQLVLVFPLVLIAVALFAGPAQAADPVIAAAGDIACAPGDSHFNSGNGTSSYCRQKYTSDLLVSMAPEKVLAVGDLQYDSGALSDFQASYDPAWGRLKAITAPALGNHESSSGYWSYFGTGNRTTPPGAKNEGFYSYDVGTWHLIALNSNCSSVACNAGSAQETWLKSDLAAHSTGCKLAYWHHPRFSSGYEGDSTFMQDLWQDLYDAGADVAIAGHSHNYERFAPQGASGNSDPAGIREFVVGTGGAFSTGATSTKPNSEVRNFSTFGVLKLTLHPSSYDWQFVPESGSFTDSGSDGCNNGSPDPGGDTRPPTAPANLTATAPSLSRVDLSWGASSDNVGVTGYEVYRDGSLIATPTGTTYSDTGVSAGTTYTYQVKARDAAGNRSAFSNTATVRTPGTTLRLPTQADAMVQQASPKTNYGTATTLRADGNAGAQVASYLRFNVLGVSGTVVSAKLRLYAIGNGTADGPTVQSTTSGWAETELTWNNRPAATSAVIADKGAISANTWVEYDVKPIVTGSGTYSFFVAPTSSDGVDFNSRESSDTTHRPQLLLTVTDNLSDNGAPPDTVITSGPTGSVNSTSASFGFASSETPSAFECKLDSSGWTPCASPMAYGAMTKGSHTFSARAIDQFGNTDSSPASRPWTVVYLPSASFDFSPAAPLVDQPVAFASTSTAVGTDAIVKHEWDLDGNGSFETNTGGTDTTSHTYPSAGTTAVKLRVTDTDGDTSTATRYVAVTATPPPSPLTDPPAPPAALPGLGVVDRKAPKLTLGGPKGRRLHGRDLVVLARCDEPCTVTGSARVSIAGASKWIRAGMRTSSLAASQRARLAFRFSTREVRQLRGWLAQGKRVYARVALVARDRAGNATSIARKIRLKP